MKMECPHCEKPILTRIQKRIISFMKPGKLIRSGNLAREVNISPELMSYHLKQMVKNGSIGIKLNCRTHVYFKRK